MIGTYAATLGVVGASLALGGAAISLCGGRRWSWLAPAVGLALLCAICWGTVRLPGEGLASALAVAAAVAASLVHLWGRLEGGGEALRVGWPIGLVALAAASLPFLVEGHFGILGTGFNPDMSQHLLATDRLAHGEASQLLRQGYPLGPHAIAVALHRGLGIGLVQGFSGLTVAVAVLAPLTALTAFAPDRGSVRSLGSVTSQTANAILLRTGAALVVGLTYVVASYFAQGAFKETMQALLLLGFVLALREADRNPDWAALPLRYVPAALLAVGSVYVYSFPGLLWLGGAAVVWALAQLALARTAPGAGGGAVGGEATARPAPRALGLALLLFLVLIAPELGRMVDFHSFETFDPSGPGLGNLFGQVSPFEALGIWPSGDFRLAPGDGAVPALAYYLGIAFGLVLLGFGTARCWRHRERAILAGLCAVALAYLAARLGGTPYTAAKAIEVGAPIVALTILLRAPRLLAALFILAAGACSLLALANAPVGPSSYSPALHGLRPLLGADSTLVLASPTLLSEQHGTPYIAWELRGGRVCIEDATAAGATILPGVRFVVAEGSAAPYPHLRRRRAAGSYTLWETLGRVQGASPCPLIAVRQTPAR